jgi:hypothetical protein
MACVAFVPWGMGSGAGGSVEYRQPLTLCPKVCGLGSDVVTTRSARPQQKATTKHQKPQHRIRNAVIYVVKAFENNIINFVGLGVGHSWGNCSKSWGIRGALLWLFVPWGRGRKDEFSGRESGAVLLWRVVGKCPASAPKAIKKPLAFAQGLDLFGSNGRT